MERAAMIRSLAAGIATCILKRLDEPILIMAIQSFKGNKVSAIPRRRPKNIPERALKKKKVVPICRHMKFPTGITTIKVKKRCIVHLKKHKKLKKMKDFVKHVTRRERVRFMENNIWTPVSHRHAAKRNILFYRDMKMHSIKDISSFEHTYKSHVTEPGINHWIDISPIINIATSSPPMNYNTNKEIYKEIKNENQFNETSNKSKVHKVNPNIILKKSLFRKLNKKESKNRNQEKLRPIRMLTRFPEVKSQMKSQRMIKHVYRHIPNNN
ncbi:unnamed protein product [Nezara viridula]|uniref:Uncharacterized protein n=1 Tax=Nezara viridula TaxID=85310 RepID=A0A9P0GYR3_NEZVI|nr:unnamed protein product [Nezara viridula]